MGVVLVVLVLAVLVLARAIYCLRRDLESLALALDVQPFRSLPSSSGDAP